MSSLCLSRRLGQAILIGDGVLIRVVQIDRGKIRLRIEAPRDVAIDREEVRERKRTVGPRPNSEKR